MKLKLLNCHKYVLHTYMYIYMLNSKLRHKKVSPEEVRVPSSMGPWKRFYCIKLGQHGAYVSMKEMRTLHFAPGTPQNPPPPNFVCVRFRTPGTSLKKKNREPPPPPPPGPQEHFFGGKKNSVNKNFHPSPPPHPAQPSEHSPQSSCNNK